MKNNNLLSTQRTASNFVCSAALLFLFMLIFSAKVTADITDEHIDNLVSLHEQIETFLDDNYDEIQRIGDRLQRIEELSDRVEAARNDPAALTGDNYAELLVELVLVIPESIQLPEPMKNYLKLTGTMIGELLGAATEFALDHVRANFERYYQSELTTGAPEWECAKKAARLVGGTRQVQLRMLWEWKYERLGR